MIIMKLFIKECKLICKSMIYFAFVGVIFIFYITQIGSTVSSDIQEAKNNEDYAPENPLMEPPSDAQNYGTKQAEIPEQIMPQALISLVAEYSANSYTTYPIGFYKTIRSNADEQQRISEIIKEITGCAPEELEAITEEYNTKRSLSYMNGEPSPEPIGIIPIIVTYEIFKEKMAEIDNILGGGSSYDETSLLRSSSIPLTYEEKLWEYENFVNEDKITGAYARLFCDYNGISIALFSIFLPVAFLMRDKKSYMNELINSRKKSSFFIVSSRYFAIIFMSILPVFVLSVLPTIQLASYGRSMNLTVDIFAYAKYILAWILPTLLTTTAVGFFITTLTETPLAIVIQFLWSFLCLNGSIPKISGGNYQYELFIRHNTLSNLQGMKDGMDALIINRVSYSILALILMMITVCIFELKRRGRLHVNYSLQKIFRRFKGTN